MKKNIAILLSIIMITLTACGKNSNLSSDNNLTKESLLDRTSIFKERDLVQDIDTTSAVNYTVSDNNDITIDKEGTYIITGKANNLSIVINTIDESKVNLIINDLTIENTDKSCIDIENADKVFINLLGNNNLSITKTLTKEEENISVIYSKDDLVINGVGTLNISSTSSGITSNDDLIITGGIININCQEEALEANNSIAISDGVITINSENDGLEAEYATDDSMGYIYISGGVINIEAKDDAIHATTILQIDGGNITINSEEGLEATSIQINDGVINISATDDGINASNKSSKYNMVIEINGGSITINMASGDTDAVDSNGDLFVNGGTINITASSAFDYDGNGEYTGGTIIVNGKETNQLTNQMMGEPRGRR